MLIEQSHGGESTSFAFQGRFDAFETDAAQERIDKALTQGQNRLRIDLSQVTFIDSSGLAELVRGMKRCREEGGDLLLENPSDPVAVILELTGLNKAFVIA